MNWIQLNKIGTELDFGVTGPVCLMKYLKDNNTVNSCCKSRINYIQLI